MKGILQLRGEKTQKARGDKQCLYPITVVLNLISEFDSYIKLEIFKVTTY